MNGYHVVEVWGERILDATETGIWCPDCNLPSMVRAKVVVGTGMDVIGTVVQTGCTECHRVIRHTERS